jgi:transcriptional regulator of met regulon
MPHRTATQEDRMTVSTPMKLITLRLDEAEKEQLAKLAADRHVTLSYALREGARLYLEDFSGKREPEPALLPLGVRGAT